MGPDTSGRMKIFEVFHDAPVQFMFNSNLSSNFIATGLPVDSYTPDTRFYVLPMFEDVLRAQNLKTAASVRRSHYRYRVTGRKIRIFPPPVNYHTSSNNKLWLRVGFPPSVVPGADIYASGTMSGSSGLYPSIPDGTIWGVSNPANIPMGVIDYNTINLWARNWIYKYTLALCTVMLGRIRTKIKGSIPIPGGEFQLNGEDLVTQGREDMKELLTGESGLIKKLESLTYDKLQEKETARAENLLKQLKFLPMPPKYVISRG